MNHYALLIKLMDMLPNEISNILELWFNTSVTCVKWNGSVSYFFRLLAGVRQGGVLSPYLFAMFIDSVVDKVKATGVGFYLFSVCVSIFSLCRRHTVNCSLSYCPTRRYRLLVNMS